MKATSTPGEILRDVLVALNVTQDHFADALGVSRYSVNQLINDRRSVTAEMALRLSRVTGSKPEFWLNLQRDVDICEAKRAIGKEVGRLEVLSDATSILLVLGCDQTAGRD